MHSDLLAIIIGRRFSMLQGNVYPQREQRSGALSLTISNREIVYLLLPIMATTEVNLTSILIACPHCLEHMTQGIGLGSTSGPVGNCGQSGWGYFTNCQRTLRMWCNHREESDSIFCQQWPRISRFCHRYGNLLATAELNPPPRRTPSTMLSAVFFV